MAKGKQPVTETHDLEETLHFNVLTPGHPPRGAESLQFKRSKKILETAKIPPLALSRVQGDRCFICGKTGDEAGHPLEAHHFSIEWSFGTGNLDWKRVKEDHPRYDWSQFNAAEPMKFVDDMAEQGLLLCKKHHTGKGTGIHNLPFSDWIIQRYLKHGERFSETEVIDKTESWR